MRDILGNPINDSSLLCWHPSPEMLKHGLIVQAVHVTDGGLSMGDTKDTTPAMLIIQIPIYVTVERGKEPVLNEMMCVVNPQATAAIDKMLEGRRKQ